MQIKVEPTSRGFSLMIDGDIWKSEPFELQFPEEVWEAFPAKEALLNELAYVLTIAPPLILKHPTVWYTTPEPCFFDFYNKCFESAIPNMVNSILSEDSQEILKRFRSTGRHFSESPRSLSFPELNSWESRRVVLPFSFGKDSLTSLATLDRLGYEVITVQVDDRVLPRVMSIRNELAKEMADTLEQTCHSVRNEIQLLSDYQVLKRPETRLHQVHIYFVYLFTMIPFCTYYRAPTIVVNNEYCNSLNRVQREGFLVPHRVMQSRTITQGMTRLVDRFSNGQITVVNLIGGLGNFALHRILHEKFPAFGAHRVSCHMEVNNYSRWCHDCDRCAQTFIYFLALGRDPFQLGFEASMLEEEKKSHYSLFKESIHRKDAYHRFIRQEEELAFLMAHRRGVEGPLMDRFRREFLPGAEKREAILKRRVFRVQRNPSKGLIRKDADSLYRKLLSPK
jgi:hypothetical protein